MKRASNKLDTGVRRESRSLLRGLAMLLAAAVGTGSAWGAVAYLYPADDAYVNNAYPTTNYGYAADLYVGDQNGNDPVQICRTYLKFDLSELVPAGATIIKAELYLREWGIGPNPPIVVRAHYLPNDSWSEGTITWNNAPTNFNASATDMETIQSGTSPDKWFQWNVTSDVQTVWAGDGVYSVVMKEGTEGTDNNWVGLSSAEDDDAAFRPFLRVAYVASPYVEIEPLDDAYVNNTYPAANYGAQSTLYVGDQNNNNPAQICRSYLKFSLQGVPDNVAIASAMLHLRAWGLGPNPRIQVGAHPLPNDTWNEATITWNNAPTNFSSVPRDALTMYDLGWFIWDVTTDIQACWANDRVYSVVMRDTTEGTDHNWVGYTSAEDTTYVPYLTIEYATDAPPHDFRPDQSLFGVWKSDSAWGDFDNDGDADLAMTGSDANGILVAVTYENQCGFLVIRQFIEEGAGVQNESSGNLAWGDCDNDGDLDLVIAGQSDYGPITRLYRNNGLGDLAWDANQPFVGVQLASVAWGDYDADGDLDLYVQGHDGVAASAALYRNGPPGVFVVDVTQPLMGLYAGSADWGDFDGDGDLDLVTTGGDGTARHTYFYRNQPPGLLVNEGNHGLPDVALSDTAWGDVDGDGDLDLAFTGEQSAAGRYACVYANDGTGGFALLGSNLLALYRSSCALGDYDNDGDLDAAFCGYDGGGLYTYVYENTGSAFTAAFWMVGVREGSLNWVDVECDGNLDLFMTGADWNNQYAELWRNTGGFFNAAPSAPTLLKSGQLNGLLLNFTGATDAETATTALYYCVRVGTTAGGHDVMSGTYSTPLMGNVGEGMSHWLNLPPGRYFWSVRTIDSGFRASPWAQERIAFRKGDVNCNGVLGFDDINPFVLLMSNPVQWQQTYPDCDPIMTGDTSGNESVGFEDINPFVKLLTGSP